MARILIADDHPFFLRGLEEFLHSAGHEVVAHAQDAGEAYALVEGKKPDLIILDVNMPPDSGIEVLKTLRFRGFARPIMLVTADISPSEALEAIQHNVNGIVMKHSAANVLIQAVDLALTGECWIDPDVLDQALREDISSHSGLLVPESGLTQREHAIALLVSRGLKNREIAEQIDVSEGTIKVHLHKVFKKINIHSRTQLALIVKEKGWI